MADKICFIICPIGDKGTDTYLRSDQLKRHILMPVLDELHYEGVRADEINRSGSISEQIIGHIIEDSMVIADLTDYNPNVFYELAIRHAYKKPFVQMIILGQKLPFDVSDQRTIKYNLSDPDNIEQSRIDLKKYIENLEQNPSDIITPISSAIVAAELRKSPLQEMKILADLSSQIVDLRNEIFKMPIRLSRLVSSQSNILTELYLSKQLASSLSEPSSLDRRPFANAAEILGACPNAIRELEHILENMRSSRNASAHVNKNSNSPMDDNSKEKDKS